MKKKASKDPWAGISLDWRIDAEHSTETKLVEITSKIALEDCATRLAKDADMDLKMKKEAAAEAGKCYSEVAKICRLKIAFIRQLREGRGNAVPNVTDTSADIAAQREEQDG